MQQKGRQAIRTPPAIVFAALTIQRKEATASAIGGRAKSIQPVWKGRVVNGARGGDRRSGASSSSRSDGRFAGSVMPRTSICTKANIAMNRIIIPPR